MDEVDPDDNLAALLSKLPQRLKSFDLSREYYAVALIANRRNQIVWERQTHWVAFSPRGTNWEIREASLMLPGRMTQAWDAIGRDWITVHSLVDLAVLSHIGGDALIVKEIAEEHLADVIGPSEAVRDRPPELGIHSYLSLAHAPDSAFRNRFARGAVRMQVMKRDDYRCRLCGRRPSDHIDLELHVHHVLPWRYGGPTVEGNLITLCKSCHDGLDPDFEPKLREIASLPGAVDNLDEEERRADVRRYRVLAKTLRDEAG